jgi:hypothetical protein
MKIYGYKTADSPDMFTSYTTRGFVLAESREEAAELFGVDRPDGFNVVAELTETDWEREISQNVYREKRIEMLHEEIDLLESVMEDIEMIQDELEE